MPLRQFIMDIVSDNIAWQAAQLGLLTNLINCTSGVLCLSFTYSASLERLMRKAAYTFLELHS